MDSNVIAMIKALGGGGSGGVSSWNDLTDKPFYETKEVVEILPETTLKATASAIENGITDAFLVLESPLSLGVKAGETCVVVFNGTEYECVAKDASAVLGGAEGYVVGNGIAFGMEDTGEPFYIADTAIELEAGVYGMVCGHDGDVISIRQEQTTIVPLPAKYLPEGYPYVEENVLMEETDAGSFGDFWLAGPPPSLTVGETYTITYNSVPYKCLCHPAPSGFVDDPNAVAMGNTAAMGGENTGEPFAMVISKQAVNIMDLVGSSAVRVKISSETIHKLDSRCLPTDATEMYLTSSGGKKFKITVSDDGTLSASAV